MKRYENLDGLRAAACMGIVATHLYGIAGYELGGTLHRVVSSWILLVIHFMVLSGFGICAGYLERFQRNEISLEKFYMRRYSRILPFFLLTTIIGVVAEGTWRGVTEGLMELSLVFGLLPNNSNCFNVNGVCWTLGTIFAFYFLFPFVSVLLKNKKRAWLALIASVLVQILCNALFMTEEFVFKGYINRSNVLYSMTVFLIGGMLYLYREDIERFFQKYVGTKLRQCGIFFICMLFTIAYYAMPDVAMGMDIRDQKTAFVFALWCIYAMGAKSIVLNNRITKAIAKYSMEIYLSHMIVLRALCVLRVTEILDKHIISFGIMLIVLMSATLVFVKIMEVFAERIRALFAR